jgi:HEAT repeat protein
VKIPKPRSRTCPAKPEGRSRKMYVLWAIALTLLISTGLFSWLVVVPAWRTRSVVLGTHATYQRIKDLHLSTADAIEADFLDRHVKRLGGEASAARLLRVYLQRPAWMAPKKHVAIGLLARCGGSGVPVLADCLSSDNYLHRIWAARSLCWVGPEAGASVAALIEALEDPDESVRSHAAKALGRIGPQASAALPALVKVFERPDGPYDEVSAVYQYPTFWSVSERSNAVWALGQVDPGGEKGLPSLAKALEDKNRFVQHAAMQAAGQIGQQASELAPVLQRLFHDDSVYTQVRAARTYWRVTGRKDGVLDCLRRGLKDPDVDVVRTIREIGVAEDLIAELTSTLSKARGSRVIDLLAITLGDLGSKAQSAIPALEELAAGKNGAISCQAAAAALKKIKAGQDASE